MVTLGHDSSRRVARLPHRAPASILHVIIRHAHLSPNQESPGMSPLCRYRVVRRATASLAAAAAILATLAAQTPRPQEPERLWSYETGG
jgi:hypothetical protein